MVLWLTLVVTNQSYWYGSPNDREEVKTVAVPVYSVAGKRMPVGLHNTIVYQYLSYTQCHCIVLPAHYALIQSYSVVTNQSVGVAEELPSHTVSTNQSVGVAEELPSHTVS